MTARARRIAIASGKGGVGKTTVALNLAVALAERGRRTLLVDVDPQGAVGLAQARGGGEPVGLADLLLGRATVADVVQAKAAAAEGAQTKATRRLSLVPRGRIDPAEADELARAVAAPAVLGAALGALEHDAEYVLLDTPSGLGPVARAALAAADFALVVQEAGPFALRSLAPTLRLVEHVRAQGNPRLALLGILATMVDLRKDTTIAALLSLWGDFGGVLDTLVPRAEVFVEAGARGLAVRDLDGPLAPEARRFALLAEEIDHRIARHVERGPGAARREEPAEERYGVRRWNDLLDECLSLAGGDAAFVMNEQGLVVASRGALEAQVAEGMGARLMVAMEHAGAIGDAGAVAVDLDGRWLTGGRLATVEAGALLYGVLGAAPLPTTRRRILEHRLADRLSAHD